MSVQLSGEARARLDAHLDAVERVLIDAGNTREQRRAVMDDLESQILEMLAAKSPTPGLADVEAVLAQLDPPSAYASADRQAPPAAVPRPPVMPASPMRPHYSRAAIWGLVCILVSLLPMVCVVPLGLYWGSRSFEKSSSLNNEPLPSESVNHITPTRSSSPRSDAGGGPTTTARSVELEARSIETGPSAANMPGIRIYSETHPSNWASSLKLVICPGLLIGPLGLLGTVLGWVAFAQIRRSGGALVGKGMALFDGLFYPILIVLIFAIALAFA